MNEEQDQQTDGPDRRWAADFARDGSLHVTDTQKTVARIHEIPHELIRWLWEEPEARQGPGSF